MAEKFSNKATTTLNGAITDTDATLIVTSASGFPATGDFRILIKADGANTDEICTVTSVSSTTFTISRATESIGGSQVASAHGDGAIISHVLTASALQLITSVGCKAYATGSTSVLNTTFTPVLLASELYDTNNFHFTSAAALTGTVSKSASSPTITGSSTSFTTELSVNQVITIPGTATEIGVVKSIASNTSLTLWQNMANNASGQTATRRNEFLAIPAGFAGLYIVIAMIEWDTNTSGERIIEICHNQALASSGSGLYGWSRDNIANGNNMTRAAMNILNCSAGDYIYMNAYQTSGGTRTTGTSNRTQLIIGRI